MNMRAWIDGRFWLDEDVGKLSAPEKLALLWLFTCPDRNNVGLVTINPRVFEFSTQAPYKVLEGAIKGLPRGLVWDGGKYVWIRHFIRDQWRPGPSFARDRKFLHTKALIEQMPEPMRGEALREYPIFGSPLQAPSEREAPCKGLISPPYSTVQYSTVQRGCGGEADGGVEAGSGPTLEEVLVECSMRGIPAEVGTAFWGKFDGCNWREKGEPVARWRSRLVGYAATWRGNEWGKEGGREKGKGRNGDREELEGELAQLRAELQGMVKDGPGWAERVARREEIKRRLEVR